MFDRLNNEIHCHGNFSPVCFYKGNLLVYKKGELLLLGETGIIDIYPLFKSLKTKVLESSRLLFRLLRLGIRASIESDDVLLFSIGKSIYEYDFSNRQLSNGFSFVDQIRPLNFTKIENISGFENCIVFGGYLSNPYKNPVCIYKHVGKDRWESVHTFGQGQVNHIHNIIPDRYSNCVWIFTGDFGDAAAIWRATDNFNKVERVLSGSQEYRGCVAFSTQDGLIYATDTPFQDNYLYLLKFDMSLHKLGTLSGSCIYGTKWNDSYVFSTTVEGDGRNSSLFSIFFDRKRGIGIKDNKVHLYIYSDHTLEEIYDEPKDMLPFAFQFGAFKFPYGDNLSDKLYFQPVGTKYHDLQLLSICQ